MTPTIEPEIHYPSGDGKPMVETGIHVRTIEWLRQGLEDFFAPAADTYVAADMFLYYERGRPDRVVAPDVMVLPGAGTADRRSFQVWNENGLLPAAVFEIASENTWREDVNEKFELYQSLGVPEYFLYDPEALYMRPALQAYRLNRTAYRRVRPRDGVLHSVLGFGVRPEGHMLRIVDSATGLPFPTRYEGMIRAQAELVAGMAEINAERATMAVRFAAEQAAMVARLAAEQAAMVAQFASEQAAMAAERAAMAAERARSEAELDRLRALLHKPGHANGNGS